MVFRNCKLIYVFLKNFSFSKILYQVWILIEWQWEYDILVPACIKAWRSCQLKSVTIMKKTGFRNLKLIKVFLRGETGWASCSQCSAILQASKASFVYTMTLQILPVKLKSPAIPQIREQILVPDLYVFTVESVAYKKH